MHKSLQQLIRRWGEERGFRANLEEDVLGGAGRVDVVLDRGDARIAVEICLTNSYAEISQTVSRCVASGFSYVVIVTTDDSARARTEKAALDAIPSRDQKKLRFVSPDGLRLFLDELSDPDHVDSDALIAGYTVRTQAPPPNQMPHRRALARLVGSALLKREASS